MHGSSATCRPACRADVEVNMWPGMVGKDADDWWDSSFASALAMASRPNSCSSPEHFVKAEDGSSPGVGGEHQVKRPPTCQAELQSSASGHPHGLVESQDMNARPVDCPAPPPPLPHEGVEKAVVAEGVVSPGHADSTGTERPTCGMPKSIVPNKTGDAAKVAPSTGQDISAPAAQCQSVSLVDLAAGLASASASATSTPGQHLSHHQQLTQPLSHSSQEVATEAAGASATSAVGNGRPQTLLPATLDLPFAEAVALLTNGFNVSRESALPNIQPMPVSSHSGQQAVQSGSGSVITSPLASPGVPSSGSTAERRKQQKRLLKKLQSAVLEYHTRLGEECVVVASIRPDNPPSSLTSSEDQRDVVIFGSQILENALQLQYDSLSALIKQHSQHISMAASAAALSTSAGTPVASTPTSPLSMASTVNNMPSSHLLPLPPRDVDLMNGNELKSYVPLLLRSLATGRARPMWGSPEHCPPWWPSDVPFRNVRMDTRAPDARGDKTWSDCLRQAVKACFRFHGCESLLRDLPRESSSQKTPMVHVTLAPQKHKASGEPMGLPAKRSVVTPSGGADIDIGSTAFNMPANASLAGGAALLSGTTVPLLNSLAGISTSLPAMSVLSSQGMQPLSLLPLTRQLRVHFKSRSGGDVCETIHIHPSLTAAQVLEHFGVSESDHQVATSYSNGTPITGPVWPVAEKHGDVFIVKVGDTLPAASNPMWAFITWLCMCLSA